MDKMTTSRRRMLQRLGGACLLSAASALGQDDIAIIWADFLGWLKSAKPSQDPGVLIRGYRRHLLERGVPDQEAGSRIARIMERMRTNSDGWRQIFNNIYASADGGFSTRPNALLVSAVENRTPGKALDAGMGQGRNSIFLAAKGWQVTGFDISDGGIQIAQKNAASAGLKINTIVADGAHFDYGSSRWDLIVITYEPFPVSDPGSVQRIRDALRPEGFLVVESFASDEGTAGRKPVDIDPARLLRAMLPLRILRLEDTVDIADWTLEKARLVRLVAQKP
ncbi:MAG: methyltransferase domain-containing protein [Acidimicrobiia bacterium]|nr:methyltransferase domain-containing protein [Acidimicrobiia bacterium]